MEEHLQKLREYLTRSGLTPVEVREGMISAYVVISRLNQMRGNPEVGLKQDAKGLHAHIGGFMGAVFWERGFNYEAPTMENLTEIKMMLDGMAQVYAMPEDLQMALNEMFDVLVARGKGEPALVSPAVMDLLQVPGTDGFKLPEADLPRTETSKKPAEPDLDIMPDEPAAEPAAEADSAPWYQTAAPEPAPAAEPKPAPAPEPVQNPESAPEAPGGMAARLGIDPDQMKEWDRIMGSDRPDEPPAKFEAGAPAAEAAALSEPASEVKPESAPEPAPAAAEEAKPKKRSSRKKTAAGGEGGESKPARKRSSKAKKPAPAEEGASVPENQAALPSEAAASEAPGAAPAAAEDFVLPGIEAASDPAPEAAAAFTPPAEPAPVESAPVESTPAETEPASEAVQAEPFFQPAPEPAATAESEPQPEPAASGTEEAQPFTSVPAAAPRVAVNLDLSSECAPAREPAAKAKGGGLVLGLLLGLVIGAGAACGWYFLGIQPQAEQRNQELTQRADALQTQLSELTVSHEALKTAAAEQAALWNKTPVKPEYYKMGKGVFFYWPDAVGRKYLLYRAKGEKDELAKVGERPLEKNCFLLTKAAKGKWRFAVAALDKDGKETEKSEIVTLTFPLKK